jgi:hypothetical protein|tara:strand:- start:163 stop:765 length:603 start_codon:yes stop_codon:yes gene_type:complete
MSKISELRLHARNRKLPAAIKLADMNPELLTHNTFIYIDLSSDPDNLSGVHTAEERHENAVAGVSTGKDVYDLGEFYNQIHTDDISLNMNYDIYNTRFAMLEPGHKIDYHMDPPNIYNIIAPLTDPIVFSTKERETPPGSVGGQYVPNPNMWAVMQIGEIWFVNPSYMHMTEHGSDETRVAILANFNYSEIVYERLTRLL